MARPLRIEYPGAIYHVMARGNQGCPIFKDDKDRKQFIDTLRESCEKTGWRVHAFVLMSNHYHLLVETPEGNLVVGMKWLQGTYTQRFNWRHELFGHLFQGRYKAILVDGSPNYLQFVSTYIHLNPARAGLVRIGQEKLHTYPWSSYPWYLRHNCPAWLHRKGVLNSLGLKESDADGFEAYTEARVLELGIKEGRKDLEEQWKRLRRGWFVGGNTFAEKLEKWHDKSVAGRKRESQSGSARDAHDQRAAERLLAKGMRALGLAQADLDTLPKAAPEKAALAWWLRGRTTVPLTWVAEQLRLGHYTRVTHAIGRMNQKPGARIRTLREQLLKLDDSEQRGQS